MYHSGGRANRMKTHIQDRSRPHTTFGPGGQSTLDLLKTLRKKKQC